jgi:hypothetical protein
MRLVMTRCGCASHLHRWEMGARIEFRGRHGSVTKSGGVWAHVLGDAVIRRSSRASLIPGVHDVVGGMLSTMTPAFI